MVSARCDCGSWVQLDPGQFNAPTICAECGREVFCASAEQLDDSAAAADFDASLLIVGGPSRETQLILLGGCASIAIGSESNLPVVLPGEDVSPLHCQLVRIDFGPSRWRIEDANSENGVWINARRIKSLELQPGDTIQIGDYELRYQGGNAHEATSDEMPDVEPAMVPNRNGTVSTIARKLASAPAVDGPICPSCARRLGRGAKICIECGIYVPSGRPLLTTQGLDENVVHGNAEAAVKLVSWLLWVTPLPIPLASEAYGKFKPYAIWAFAAITTLVSIWFLAISFNGEPGNAKNLMLWPPHGDISREADALAKKLPHLQHAPDGLPTEMSDADLREEAEIRIRLQSGEFHGYQLITHAFLHDPGSILGFIFHLGGNMLFLIVFGSRVNAIVGSRLTAFLYPLLAIASAGIYLLTLPAGASTPLLGASGAIMGLAGMYLVLFPSHKVYCAMWFRFRLQFVMKVFALRGFWILLIYFAYDLAMVLLNSHDNTAHWAHIGGFITGVLLGFALLLSRKFNCRNGDILSMTLGKRAWPLIGKPNRWSEEAIPVGAE